MSLRKIAPKIPPIAGMKTIDNNIDNFGGGEGNECRLLVGMQRLPYDELKEIYKISKISKTT